MPIPKVIYQTYSSKSKIPWIAQYHIKQMCKMNPSYEYRFYDDHEIDKFIQEEFDSETYSQYLKLNIGAAKADFFRYAMLFKKGGVYVDIDSRVAGDLDDWILPDDTGIITAERHPGMYVQWALVYDKGHPFLKKTLENVLDNIKDNRYPHDIHKMTGPTVYSDSIRSCINDDPSIEYRDFGTDYEGRIQFKYWLSGLSYWRKEHWRKTQKRRPILNV